MFSPPRHGAYRHRRGGAGLCADDGPLRRLGGVHPGLPGDLLPDEADYTRAMSLSRLAADLESVASPVLADLLLAVMSYSNLVAGTTVGFVVSTLFVISASLPALSTAPALALRRKQPRRRPAGWRLSSSFS